MCSEYKVRTTLKEIEKELKTKIANHTKVTEWDKRVRLTATAPILRQDGEKVILTESVFPKFPFPNARLSSLEPKKHIAAHGPGDPGEEFKRIYEKPTWKKAFAENRGLAVMSSFLEPAYWGEHAGDVMEFSPPKGKLFFVPALLIAAKAPKTTNAFSLLTHTATPQMLEFHHRMIVLLEPRFALEWLRGGHAEPEEKFDFLVQHRFTGKLLAQPERKMASGWKPRVAQHKDALESEMEYRKELQRKHLAA